MGDNRRLQPITRLGDALAFTWLRAVAVALPVVVLAAIAGMTGGTVTLALAGGLLGFLSAVALLLRFWPWAGLVVLIVSAAVNRYTLPVMGINLRAEQVASILLSLVIFQRSVIVGKKLRVDWGFILLLCWIGLNYVSSALHAPNVAQSVKEATLLAVTVLPPYVLAINLLGERRHIPFVLKVWFAIAVLEGLLGMLATILWRSGRNIGMQLVYTGGYSPYGTLWESNIYGSYLAAAASALFVLIVSRRRYHLHVPSLVAFGIMAMGVLVSLSRTPWFALGLIVSLVSLVKIRQAGFRILTLAFLGLLLAMTVTIIWLSVAENSEPSIFVHLVQRLVSLRPSQILSDDTLAGRFDIYRRALEDGRAHPYIGWGTGVYGQRFNYSSVALPGWIGNLFLHVFYDTGIMGLGLVSTFILWLGFSTVTALHRITEPTERAYLLALGAAGAALLIAYQLTEGTWLAFTWVNVGILAATTHTLRRTSSQLQSLPRGSSVTEAAL